MTYRQNVDRQSGRVPEASVGRMPKRFVLSTISIFLISFLLFGGFSEMAHASELSRQDLPEDLPLPRSFAIPWQGDDLYTSPDVDAVGAAQIDEELGAVRLIIDSDFGVDDVVAVATMLSPALENVTIDGIVTVAGVTSVDQAVDNALLLLEQYGLTAENISVVKGAKKPWKQKLSSSGKLIHGPDGLWWLADISPKPDTKPVAKDAVKFYCKETDLAGATILAIGPLTNVADALKKCPDEFTQAEGLKFIILGGADIGGNQTPVSEYNFWQDPGAAEYVFDFAKPDDVFLPAKLNITLIPQDTFEQYGLTTGDIQELAQSGNSVAEWLTLPPTTEYPNAQGPLPLYFGALANGNPAAEVPVPDLVAAAYAVDSGVQNNATRIPAIVDIVGDKQTPELAAGQSLIAYNDLLAWCPSLDPSDESWVPCPGTNEQIMQVFDDGTISALADQAVSSERPYEVELDPLYQVVGPVYYFPPTNAEVVTKIRPRRVGNYLAKTLGAPFSLSLETSAASVAGREFDMVEEADTLIYLPLVGSE